MLASSNSERAPHTTRHRDVGATGSRSRFGCRWPTPWQSGAQGGASRSRSVPSMTSGDGGPTSRISMSVSSTMPRIWLAPTPKWSWGVGGQAPCCAGASRVADSAGTSGGFVRCRSTTARSNRGSRRCSPSSAAIGRSASPWCPPACRTGDRLRAAIARTSSSAPKPRTRCGWVAAGSIVIGPPSVSPMTATSVAPAVSSAATASSVHRSSVGGSSSGTGSDTPVPLLPKQITRANDDRRSR